MKEYDLIIVGSGTAGRTAAPIAKEAGWKVAVVDERPFGGTCPLRGCVPKKVLVGASEAIDWNLRMKGKGIDPGSARMVWKDLIDFKRTFTDPKPAQIEAGIRKAGIDILKGRAVFIDKDTLQVGKESYRAKKFLVVTGSKPMDLGIPGEELIDKSDEFLEMEKLPKRIAFIGGGYISFEFAHISRRAGAEVMILHRSEKVLKNFDQDAVDRVLNESKEIGIKVYTNTPVLGVEKKGDSFLVQSSGGKEFEVDLVVHGSGRVPDLEGLNLEAAEVEYDRRGVKVNDFLQSVSNPNVFAAGDCADTEGAPLSPVAGLEGRVAGRNMVEGKNEKPDYSVVPSVVFTLPPVAMVGLNEEAAKKKGIKFETRFQDTSERYSSKRIGHKHSSHKVLVEEGSGRILGAHLAGPNAEDVINFYALAIKMGATADQIKEVPWAFPSASNDVKDML